MLKPVIFEPTARRLRVMFNGETVADTVAGRLLIETAVPVYCFPIADVRADLLVPSEGGGRRWSIVVGDRTAPDAVAQVDVPAGGVADSGTYVRFDWDSMDRWIEEDEEVFRHARNPYKRVDALRSTRRVEVVLDGVTVADSRAGVFLFETGLPTRYYLPIEDVRRELLVPSRTESLCPYKGRAQYYHLAIGDRLHEDVVWYYLDPIPECARIKGLLAFWNEFVDAIAVDGINEPRVATAFSGRAMVRRPVRPADAPMAVAESGA